MMGPRQGPAFFSYSDNYLIGTDHRPRDLCFGARVLRLAKELPPPWRYVGQAPTGDTRHSKSERDCPGPVTWPIHPL